MRPAHLDYVAGGRQVRHAGRVLEAHVERGLRLRDAPRAGRTGGGRHGGGGDEAAAHTDVGSLAMGRAPLVMPEHVTMAATRVSRMRRRRTGACEPGRRPLAETARYPLVS